jgi:signal transduction histidine kinase
MIAMAVVGSYFISKKVSRPIISINNAAKKLAARDYQPNFSEGGYREVSELGVTLNYAARELSKVDDMCRELIANISHDLRTPLTMIKGYAEVMRDLPDENTPENVQIIVDEANRLTTLVNDVLDISHFQSGRQKFEFVSFNLTKTVSEAVERYSALNERNGYTFDFYNDSERDAWVTSDETRILQVLYNLLNNAITYTGEDKRITVRQIVSDGKVRIEVSDTGEGIAEDQINEIWERYYKIDKSHRRAAVGSGLGLPIVKQIMQMAGGGCGVRSRVNSGSTFYFELPITEKKSDD